VSNWEVTRIDHPDGEIRIPVIRIEGANDGPTLGVAAGVHGSEFVGIEAAKRLGEIDPGKLTGRLVIIPIVNVPAFLAKSIAICPVDGASIGRLFPGNADGSYTEALTAGVWEIMKDVDYAIDLHGGDMHEYLTPYSSWPITGDLDVDRVSEGMARAFDMPFILGKRGPERFTSGSFYDAMGHAGKPAILAEAGNHGETTEDLIANTHYRGIINVMKFLGMLEGEVDYKHTQIELTDFIPVKAPFDGHWYPVVSAGQTVHKGQIVGEVVELFNRDRQTLRAPVTGVVFGGVTSLPARKDQLVIGLGPIAE